MIRFFLKHPDAKPPARAHDYDAAFDVHSCQQLVLKPREPIRIDTGLVVSVPPGYVIQVLPRSGLATDHAVTVANAPGLIDPGYRGELGVSLINLGRHPYEIFKGDRIAQLLVVQYAQAPMQEVANTTELHDPPDARGEGGFGSTGR